MGTTFKYRTADGSYNVSYLTERKPYPSREGNDNIQNVLYPDLGKAGSFYARSVVPQRPLQAPLPDPATIFDGIRHKSLLMHSS